MPNEQQLVQKGDNIQLNGNDIPTVVIADNMNQPDGTPGKMDLADTPGANLELDVKTARGNAVVTGDGNATVNVAANADFVRSVERRPGTTDTIIRSFGTDDEGKIGNFSLDIHGPKSVNVTLDDRSHTNETVAAGNDGSKAVGPENGFRVSQNNRSVTETINSDVGSAYGEAKKYELGGGNDKADLTLGDGASGNIMVDGGSGQDTLTIRAKDGKLVTLGNGDKQFIQSLGGKNLVMNIKNVETVNVIFEGGSPSAPAKAPATVNGTVR